MDLGLNGKVALVTGASKGIGRGIAAELVAEGARVAISSHSRERVEATGAEIGATAYVHDTSDLDHAAALVAEVEEALGPIDVLVCNTGGPPGGPDALDFTRDQWQAAYTSLVLGPMALVEAVVPGMRERGFGRVVNVASTGVREPIPNLMLSNAHRISMINAFKTIARQVAADGVTLNTVLPGRIDTDRLAELLGSPRGRRGSRPSRRSPPAAWAPSRSSRPSPCCSARRARATSRARRWRSTAGCCGRCSEARDGRRSTPRESRTPAASVKGWCANHYTMGAGRPQSRGRFPSVPAANIRSCDGRTSDERHGDCEPGWSSPHCRELASRSRR